MDVKPEEKQEILETIDLSRASTRCRASGPAARGAAALATRSASRPRPRFDERQREALLREQMAAIQRQLGEGDGKAAEIAELDGGDRQGQHADGGRTRRRKKELRRYERMPEAAGESRHGPHLSRLADRAALGAARGEADRHRGGAPHPRRGPFRPREDQAPHHRISRGAQARAAGQGADPVLRRAARRRQDLARPVDRARHGPQVRARQPRRRA